MEIRENKQNNTDDKDTKGDVKETVFKIEGRKEKEKTGGKNR